MKNAMPDGFHYLIEFFGCDAKKIDSVPFWKKLLADSLDGTSMKGLHQFFYKFEPHGLTGFVLLSSSHISMHTWPENEYVVCDVFTCSTEKEIERVTGHLKKNLPHKKFTIKKVRRGFQVCRNKWHIDPSCISKKLMKQPIYSTGGTVDIEIYDTLVEIDSEFQKISFVDTKRFGKCLMIDGVVQTSETDHRVYDQEMLKKLKLHDKRILILGGGDGYIAQLAVEKNPKINVDIIDLDIEVVRGCEQYLGQEIFSKRNVHMMIGDALHYLKHTGAVYDGIVCDLTDAPIGSGKEKAEFEKFYGEIMELSGKRLVENGWISVQSGASKVAGGHVDAVKILKVIMKEHFDKVERSDIFIPSYGESCAFLFGKKGK